jgi:hypothetical protein
MKVVIATPLYPPDLAEPAPYSKELARRLVGAHDVTVLAYGYLPEAVPGVKVEVVNKRQPLPVRLFLYTLSLLGAAKNADVVIAENGPSVALPAGLVARLVRIPFIMHVGDAAAHAHGINSAYGFPERLLEGAAAKVVSDMPLPRPEVLPFGIPAAHSPEAYEASWETHLAALFAGMNHEA